MTRMRPGARRHALPAPPPADGGSTQTISAHEPAARSGGRLTTALRSLDLPGPSRGTESVGASGKSLVFHRASRER